MYAGHKVKCPGGYLKFFKENYGKNIEFTEMIKKKSREANKKRYWLNHEDIIKKRREEFNQRRKNDINFLIKDRLRVLLKQAFRIYTKTGKIMSSRKYGIDYKAIIEHLKPFPEDLSKYHIDHIRPLCSFNLTNSEEVKKAFAPENHQWLTAEENWSKNGRWNGNN